ncbi:ER-golgi trafficking TRAPP I complex 85 kDa subunit-domain-containing protein [Auriculariales sp. MPI-PUGE-AT-0066]|nr:ER-golgi trafficking TRAPP I complex 85 kDa subunit-domain-containing protein [Auriculariales sp. MPI-PUGE-AT-0066]
MAAVLPSSLSPHICVLPSPDLVALLNEANLPPLHHLLQSFSPLQNVTSRTTALATVALASFALRFSDLGQTETACKEGEDARAGRTIDWLGARATRKASEWLDDGARVRTSFARTAWWDELRRCAEGDLAPSRAEGWNHPTAIILAVSTNSSNPLAAISALHSRPVDLPQWVDPNILRFTLVIHTPRSTLSDEECGALMNACKKQYGVHSHFLSLELGQPAFPIPLFTLPPRLPLPADASLPEIPEQQELRMSPTDLQQAAKFAREFVVMSLVPWMERCILDWNENFAANRRVATRLFSTTRRLFGTTTTTTTTSNGYPSSPGGGTSPVSATGQQPPPASAPPQQRRLAEFATILGDYKLAIPVWEAWRKEGRGGSEILPLLLAPSPAVGAHVAYALQPFQHAEQTALTQFRALLYAVRWEVGVPDFVPQGGDRWLSWAAGHSEEPYAAILLSHAALLAARAGGMRRASMWYVDAALRMEKSGIKPLAIHFLRQADEILKLRRNDDNVSPLFEPAVGPSPTGFPALPLRIEHSLARLLYSTGKVTESARLFAELFRAYTDVRAAHLLEEDSSHAQGIIDDFRVAFEHIHSTGDKQKLLAELQPAISLVVPAATKLRFDGHGSLGDIAENTWAGLDAAWSAFAKRQSLGASSNSNQAGIGERFWVDVALQNPLPVEIVMTKVRIHVETAEKAQRPDVETLDEIILAPKESRTVSVAVIAHHASKLRLTHLTYSFLSLLPMRESLARRGKRLDATPAQRQTPTYTPDTVLTVDVGNDAPRLDVSWTAVSREHDFAYIHQPGPHALSLARGEVHATSLAFANVGAKPVTELWLARTMDSAVVALGRLDDNEWQEVISSHSTLESPEPQQISLEQCHSSPKLQPGESCLVPIVISPPELGAVNVCIVALFRENSTSAFRCTRIHRSIAVHDVVETFVSAAPRANADGSFVLNLELENKGGDSVEITDICTISPSWSCSLLANTSFSPQLLHPSQSTRFLLQAQPWLEGKGGLETEQHTISMLAQIVGGQQVTPKAPPTLDLKLSNVSKSLPSGTSPRANGATGVHLPVIPPRAVDVVIQWSIPTEKRFGQLVLANQLTLGATHGSLNALLEGVRTGKAKRTMFAETDRAKAGLLNALEGSTWNEEMNPLSVSVSAPSTRHDFSQGPCSLPVSFSVHNYSASRSAKFVLRLSNDDRVPAGRKTAAFVGRLAYRGTLPPHGHSTVTARVWIPLPGQYQLGRWSLETHVADADASSSDFKPAARYLSHGQEHVTLDVSDA